MTQEVITSSVLSPHFLLFHIAVDILCFHFFVIQRYFTEENMPVSIWWSKTLLFFKLLQNMVESFWKSCFKTWLNLFEKSCFKTWLNLFLKVASKHGWIFFKLLQNRKAFFPHKRCILVCLQMMFAQTFCSPLITWKNLKLRVAKS